MEVKYIIKYNPGVLREDVPRLGVAKKRIEMAILTKLQTNPAHFGKPLRDDLKGYRKLRVGDFRVIFWIDKTTVKIEKIGHRSKVY